MTNSIRAALLATVAFSACAIALSPGANAATLHALGLDNKIARIDTDSRKVTGTWAVSGTDGKLVGVAVRPADGKLYGLTDTGQIVTIDTTSGQATQVSRLGEKIDTGARTAIRFNPVVDRLRVVGVNGNNYRIHVDTGAVTTDKPLRYADGSAQAGQTPMVTAAAYTNAMAGAKETALYTLDPRLGQVNLQAPPNDGVQQPKANAGMALPYGVGFDFLSDGNGGNWGFVVAAGKLHSYSAADAKFSTIGPIAGLTWNEILGIAATK